MLPCKEKATSCIMTGVMPNIATLTKDVIDDIYDWMKFGNPHHLYFLSDEEIKVGDWCVLDLEENTRVVKVESLNSGHPVFTVDITDGYAQLCGLKKITATTDKSLELPEPSPEFIDKFIREYNKGNVIEEVMVEYDAIGRMKSVGVETHISEILKVDKNNCITITKVKDSWSREEIINDIESAMIQNLTIAQYRDKWIK